MWGRRDSSDSADATRRRSALTRDLQSLSDSAPDHAGATAGAAPGTSHTQAQDCDADHEAAEQSGAVPIRHPNAAMQAASLQMGGNATHYAPNSLHLGAHSDAFTLPACFRSTLQVCLANVWASSGSTQHARQVRSAVCALARQARRRSSAPSSTETRARQRRCHQRRRCNRRGRRPCRTLGTLRR